MSQVLAPVTCPECHQDHDAELSHKIGRRYLCQEGASASGPHRFVLVTARLDIVAEADTVEDATRAAAFLSGEQKRVITPMETSVLEERLAIAAMLERRRATSALVATAALEAGNVDLYVLYEGRVDLLRDLATELSTLPVD